MKEQVIASRGSRRAATTKGLVQRPARRGSSGRSRFQDFSVRTLLAYVPSAFRIIFGILLIVTLVVGYRAAASGAFFQVRSVEVSGTARTSPEEIEGLARRAVAKTGVWRADLSALSSELSRLPGIRQAVVTRVLPDRLRIRVSERQPLAVVRTSSGHLVWVDEEGVVLGEMKPSDRMPAFFFRGWNEDGTNDARAENTERVRKYLELVEQWNSLGLSQRVSEVNLIDVRDVRAQLDGDDSQIEVRLGGDEPGKHLKLALDILDRYKQTNGSGLITYIDVQGDKVILGTGAGNKAANTNSTSAANTNAAASPQNPESAATRTATAKKSPPAGRSNAEQSNKSDKKPAKTGVRVR